MRLHYGVIGAVPCLRRISMTAPGRLASAKEKPLSKAKMVAAVALTPAWPSRTTRRATRPEVLIAQDDRRWGSCEFASDRSPADQSGRHLARVSPSPGMRSTA